MANNVQETLRELLISTIEGAGKNVGGDSDKSPAPESKGGSGHKGLAAGLGMAALAPVAAKGLGKLAQQAGMEGVQDLVKSPGKAVEGLGSSVGGSVGDKVSDKVDEAGGPSGILSDTVKNALPFGGGGGGGSKGGGLGVGKGRRMPVQQSIDIAAPLETVYNQWTQFEDWPSFMHRVVRASQDEDDQVTFEVKIWTRKREFTADIETQTPNERIKWKVSSGMTHAGLVSFHELGPNLTRVLLSIDVQPGGVIEKMARGMRHVKRAARGDLHRFKAFIEMAGQESGAWRGVIEDGEVVEEHDPSYDEGREYSDPEDVIEGLEDQDEDSDEDEKDEDEDSSSESDEDSSAESEGDDEPEAEEQPRARRRRRPSTNGHGSDDESSSPRRSRSGSGSSSSRSSGRSRAGSGSRSSGNGSSASSEGAGSRSRSTGGRSASKSGASKPSASKSSASKSSASKGRATKSSSSRSSNGSGASGGSSSKPRSRSRSSKS